jgi:hypothetical protein
MRITAPTESLQGLARGNQFSARWIQVDVITDCLQVTVAAPIHGQGFVATGEEMAAGFVADVKAPGVNAQQPFHAGDEVGLRRLKNEMKMIAHEAPGMDLPAGFGARLPESGQEKFAVVVVANDIEPVIAAAHHVIDRARVFDSEFAGHEGQDADEQTKVNDFKKLGLTPALIERNPNPFLKRIRSKVTISK